MAATRRQSLRAGGKKGTGNSTRQRVSEVDGPEVEGTARAMGVAKRSRRRARGIAHVAYAGDEHHVIRRRAKMLGRSAPLFRSRQLAKAGCTRYHGYRRLGRGFSYCRLVHARVRNGRMGMGLCWNGIGTRCNLQVARCYGNSATNELSDQAATGVPLLRITTFDSVGEYTTTMIRRSELVARYGIQPRDIRFSVSSSLFTRASSIILKLQHIKAIINAGSVVLLDSDHPAILEFIPELQEKLRSATSADAALPFEFRVLEAMLLKILSVLDERLSQLAPALREVLNSLLDPRLFSVDRGELHILLHHSKHLSEFHSVVRDIEATLNEVLDSEEDMADMYLTHWHSTGEDRDLEDTEELCNILEAYSLQVEDMMSEVQKLRELIDQSESVILINLDSQRNVMLRLGLQLEMGMFSASIGGLVGMAFGMNLDSSLEENPYAFWVVAGIMVSICGLLWRRLLMFLGKLDRSPLKRIARPPTARTKK